MNSLLKGYHGRILILK